MMDVGSNLMPVFFGIVVLVVAVVVTLITRAKLRRNKPYKE